MCAECVRVHECDPLFHEVCSVELQIMVKERRKLRMNRQKQDVQSREHQVDGKGIHLVSLSFTVILLSNCQNKSFIFKCDWFHLWYFQHKICSASELHCLLYSLYGVSKQFIREKLVKMMKHAAWGLQWASAWRSHVKSVLWNDFFHFLQ